MTDYPFGIQLAVAPLDENNIIRDGEVWIFAPTDTNGTTPLDLKDLTGLPMVNPLRSNAFGNTRPFITSVPQVKWKSGIHEGLFDSFVGLRNEALAAVTAASGAQAAAETLAAEALATAAVDGTGSLILTKASGATVNAGSVKGAKGDKGDTGLDGSNVLPTDIAIKQAMTTPGTETATALDATIGIISGVVFDDAAAATANTAAINAALAQGGAWRLPQSNGTCHIDGPLEVSVPGTIFLGKGTLIRQTTAAQSVFDVLAADVTIELDAIGQTGTLDITGQTATAWELSIIASRATAINAYSGADRLHVPWIRARGFSSAVRVTNWIRILGAVSAERVKDVKLGTLLCSNVEFGLVVQGTDRFTYDHIAGSYLYPIGGPRAPHLIYFSGIGGENQDVNGGTAVATYESGAGGQAFQFKGVARGEIRSLEANGCPGVLNVMDCQDLQIGYLNSKGDTCTDAYGSISMSATSGTLERVTLGAVKVQMVSNGIPFRTLSGDRLRIRDMDVEVNHTTSGTVHDVSIAGTNTEIIRLNIRNVGTASWRGLGLWSGDGHRIGQVKATNVRVGVEVRTTATNAVVGYDSADITLHGTDGYQKIIVAAPAAPTLRLPGKPGSTSRTKVLDRFELAPESGTSFGPALTGQAWTVQAGTWAVNTTTGVASETGNVTRSNTYVDTGMANAELRVPVKLKAYDGIMLRRVSATEYLCAYLSLTGVVIAKWDAAALTTLASGPAVTYTAGRWYSLKVQVFGTKIDVYVDNVFSVSYTLAAGDDTKFGTSTQHGLFCSAAGGLNGFKEFEAVQL